MQDRHDELQVWQVLFYVFVQNPSTGQESIHNYYFRYNPDLQVKHPVLLQVKQVESLQGIQV